MEKHKSHFELAKELIANLADQDSKDEGKTVKAVQYYSPVYEYLIATELAIMNDYLKKIAETLAMSEGKSE